MLRLLSLFMGTLCTISSFAQCPTDTISLSTQADIDSFASNFPGCTAMEFDLWISGSDITDLSGLNQLSSMAGRLIIQDNPNLVSLDGLSPIEFIGGMDGLTVENNVSLVSLSEFSGSLSYDNLGLEIRNNPNLISLNGLSGITGVDGLFIENNDALVDLEGLSGVTGAYRIYITNNEELVSTSGLENISLGGSLYIDNNPNLASISSLISTSTYTEVVGIHNNPKLASLDGLQGIDVIEVEGLTINNNDSLLNLEGLNSLTEVWFNIRIEGNELLSDISALENAANNSIDFWLIKNNPNLSECSVAALCQYIEQGELTDIQNNGAGCSSEAEVQSSCMTCPNSLITLTSQADVDNFAITYNGCTDITAGLIIASSTDITDLSPLSIITSISGGNPDEDFLTIWNNAALQNLNGLENMGIGSANNRPLVIKDNPQLSNIMGLSGLSGILNGEIQIRNNPLLESLEGLENIELTSQLLQIQNNPLLQDLSGLEGITILDALSVAENQALLNFQGLENLTFIGDLFIVDNAALESLDGLNAVEQIAGAQIEMNPNLIDISAFENAELIIPDGGLQIKDNNSLAVCNNSMVCDYLSNTPPGTGTIENNAPGCNSILEVENSCALSVLDVNLKASISLYPNPVSEVLLIHTSEEVELQKVIVFSPLGEVLLISSEYQLDFSNLSNGIYFVELNTDFGTSTRRIVKE